MGTILEEGLREETPWDPKVETVQAHYSSISLHRKCPEAWYFRYGLGLGKPILGPVPYLWLGSWYGLWRTAEALERGRSAGSLLFEPRTDFRPIDRDDGPIFDQTYLTTGMVMDAAQAWWDKMSKATTGTEFEDSWQSIFSGTLMDRLKAMSVRWRDEFGEAAKNELPLGLEVFWKRELPRPWADLPEPGDYDMDQLPRVVLIGFIDEVLWDKQRGITIVRDNKTSSKMETMTAFVDMTDSQLALYAWGVTPKLKSVGGETPRAMSFDRIMSKPTALPQLNMDGSISARSKIWDVRTYRDWVAEGQTYPGKAKDGSQAGVYVEDPDIVRRLSQPQWKAQFIQRTMVPISKPMVVAHLRAATDSVTDIWRTQKRAERSGEAARNLTKDGCRWCDFAAICRARMFGGTDSTVTYDLREYGLVAKGGHLLTGTTIHDGEDGYGSD